MCFLFQSNSNKATAEKYSALPVYLVGTKSRQDKGQSIIFHREIGN